MKNNFLDKNNLIKEAIFEFRAEPTRESYDTILMRMHERMAEDGHFLLPIWIPEEEKDSENPSFNLHQDRTIRFPCWLCAKCSDFFQRSDDFYPENYFS